MKNVEVKKVRGVYLVISKDTVHRKGLNIGDMYVWVSSKGNIVKWNSPRTARTKKIYWMYSKDWRSKRLMMVEYVRQIHTDLF